MDPAPDPWATAAAGQRWVVRYRLPDGSATDLIGWLEEVGSRELRIALADTAIRTVPRLRVIAARRVPSAQGGREPRRTSAAELERHTLPGWLALSEPLGEWTLRAGGGFTGRANSVHAVGDPGVPTPEAAEQVLVYAARHAIAPMAQVVSGSAEETALRSLGWTDTYVPTEVLAVRLADLLGASAPPEGVEVTEVLQPSWEDAFQESRPNTADPVMLRMILDGHPPRAFASVRVGSQTVGIARGHLSGPWLGLASIWTAPGHRRKGRASAMIAALGHWAARRGARYAYLQVASGNGAALAAYARAGFVPHHRYGYLRPPGAEASSSSS